MSRQNVLEGNEKSQDHELLRDLNLGGYVR